MEAAVVKTILAPCAPLSTKMGRKLLKYHFRAGRIYYLGEKAKNSKFVYSGRWRHRRLKISPILR